MSIGNGTQPQQNQAHRDDLTWVKVGRSEYMRSDGTTIRKMKDRQWWWAYGPDGEHLYRNPNFKVGGHSLTWAKIAVEAHEEA